MSDSRLVEVPEIPDGAPEPFGAALRALRHNFNVLAGFSGDDRLARAITFGAVKVADLDPQQSTYSAAAPTKTEFDKVIDDLTAYRDRINYLIALLRGESMGG
jgi:hypothetical protein